MVEVECFELWSQAPGDLFLYFVGEKQSEMNIMVELNCKVYYVLLA